MLIGIDASRTTVSQRTGTEGYSLHIINGLIALGPEHQFRLYVRDEPGPGLFPQQDNVEVRYINQPRLWTHRGLGPEVRSNPPDVLFVPAHVIPWPGVGSVPSVVTLHDLGYLHYPGKHALLDRMYLNWSTRHSASTATRVITPSKATAHDLNQLNNISLDKISVVYSGVTDFLNPGIPAEDIAEMRLHFGIDGPYIMHVGRVEPRKNLGRLVQAFARIKPNHPDLKLVLAGRPGRDSAALQTQVEELGLADDVLFAGYVPDEMLPALYCAADLYAFPSLYEGFGFPALEAMASGTPVVCSNTSSLPELVGDAALTVPPTDIGLMANALERVLTDPDLSASLVHKGLERVAAFTWESASQHTLEVLADAASVASQTIITVS